MKRLLTTMGHITAVDSKIQILTLLCTAGVAGSLQTRHRALGQLKEHTGFLVSRNLTLPPLHPTSRRRYSMIIPVSKKKHFYVCLHLYPIKDSYLFIFPSHTAINTSNPLKSSSPTLRNSCTRRWSHAVASCPSPPSPRTVKPSVRRPCCRQTVRTAGAATVMKTCLPAASASTRPSACSSIWGILRRAVREP